MNLDDDILDVLLIAERGMCAMELAERLKGERLGPASGHLIQKVRVRCRALEAEGKIQQDHSQLFHNTGSHWIHTFHAACRYVGRQRVSTGGIARRTAVHQYAPHEFNRKNVEVSLDLLWAEVLDLRAELADLKGQA